MLMRCFRYIFFSLSLPFQKEKEQQIILMINPEMLALLLTRFFRSMS
jgi:hypothetical protein